MASGLFYIILFDGTCNLCNSTVQWIIRHDNIAKFRFVASQSETGQYLLHHLHLPVKESNSVVYINNSGIYTRSSAILNILKDMDNGWRQFYHLRIVPKCIRDGIYTLIAKTRYKIFGKKEYCDVQNEDLSPRFQLSESEILYITG